MSSNDFQPRCGQLITGIALMAGGIGMAYVARAAHPLIAMCEGGGTKTHDLILWLAYNASWGDRTFRAI